MTTNGVNNVDEADITECDGETVVTMMDVLQEQQEFEEDANAVLGASDDKECTYSKGYIKRQAIYACLTCCSGAKDDPTLRAGVCLACSLNCHENHELIELYTKRNFRCDCGNPKFNSNPCQFTPNKTELNEDNHYNQNFSGLYCVCHRSYPDMEATVEDEMIQCIICEDWLHSNHLEAVVPGNDLYAEMICKSCMEKNEFLHDYSQIAINYEQDVDITTVNGLDNSKIDDAKSSPLVNEKLNNCDVNDVDMEKGETEETGNISNKEDKPVIEDDIKTNNETISNLEITSTDCATENFENQQPEETSLSVPTVNHNLTSTSNSTVELEQNNKPNEPVIEVKQEVDIETQLNLMNSESNTNEMNTQDTEEKKDDENNLTTETSIEQSESVNEQTEEVLNSTNNTEHKTNLFNTNTVMKTNNEESENESRDSDNKELDAVSSALREENNQPTGSNNLSESKENVSEKVPENTDTKVSPQQKNDCEIDSLEAATKELSELMADGESNQSSNSLGKTKPNEVQKENISENQAIADVSDMRGEDINDETNRNTSDNENKLSNNTEQDHKRKIDDTTDEVLVKKQKLDISENCLRPRNVKRTIKGAAFWPSTFRLKLCTCNDCLSMYKDLSVLYLTDLEDTVTAYEALGKEKIDGGPATQYEKGLQALSSLDRVQQINALTEYNRMRDKLLDFLKSFKDRKEIVKEEDIRAFFAGMKPRREPDGVYFCR